MSYPSFIIFKDARRFQAGYLDLAGDVKTFTFRGRDYHFAGQVFNYCNLTTDGKNRLVGFVLTDVLHHVKEPAFSPWFDDAENGINEGDFHFLIHWPCSEAWEQDGSCLIGANVYHDNRDDFLTVISDGKANDESGQFQNLWSEIAFSLASAEQFVVKEYFPKGEIKADKS